MMDMNKWFLFHCGGKNRKPGFSAPATRSLQTFRLERKTPTSIRTNWSSQRNQHFHSPPCTGWPPETSSLSPVGVFWLYWLASLRATSPHLLIRRRWRFCNAPFSLLLLISSMLTFHCIMESHHSSFASYFCFGSLFLHLVMLGLVCSLYFLSETCNCWNFYSCFYVHGESESFP